MRFGELFPRIEDILLKADYLHHCHLEIETETSIVMTNPGSDEVKGLDPVKEKETDGDNSHLKRTEKMLESRPEDVPVKLVKSVQIVDTVETLETADTVGLWRLWKLWRLWRR